MSPVPSPVELQPEGETPTSGSETGELPVVGPDDNPVENREEAETLTDPDATIEALYQDACVLSSFSRPCCRVFSGQLVIA